MAEVITQRMNADKVGKNLWVGGLPTDPGAVSENFDALVLAARDHQEIFPVHKYPKTRLILAPLDDDPYSTKGMSAEQQALALRAALDVHKLNSQGKTVLVTCAAGVNRSALIAGLAMVISGDSAQQAIDRIRKHRKPPTGSIPLFNPHFRKMLRDVEQELKKTDSPTR